MNTILLNRCGFASLKHVFQFSKLFGFVVFLRSKFQSNVVSIYKKINLPLNKICREPVKILCFSIFTARKQELHRISI